MRVKCCWFPESLLTNGGTKIYIQYHAQLLQLLLGAPIICTQWVPSALTFCHNITGKTMPTLSAPHLPHLCNHLITQIFFISLWFSLKVFLGGTCHKILSLIHSLLFYLHASGALTWLSLCAFTTLNATMMVMFYVWYFDALFSPLQISNSCLFTHTLHQLLHILSI